MKHKNILIINRNHRSFKSQINRLAGFRIGDVYDFIFDQTHQILLVALDFDGHPILRGKLEQLADGPFAVVGGRLGRIDALRIGSSEWSGHFGEAWDDESRDQFSAFMSLCGLQMSHKAWQEGQTANQIGVTELAVRDIALIGLGPHARRIYYPLIEKYQREFGLNLRILVELEDKRAQTEAFIEQSTLKPDICCYIPANWKRTDRLPTSVSSILQREIRQGRLQGFVIAADPRSHMPYYELALSNNCHVLTDKPLTAPMDLSSKPEQGPQILNDFQTILDLSRNSRGQFIVQAQRRMHPGYLMVRKILRDIIQRTEVPLTSVSIQHGDGMWVMPHEWGRDSHPYKYGYGKLLHSGYHFIDLLCWLLQENDALPCKIDAAEVLATGVYPNDKTFVYENTYRKLLNHNAKPTNLKLRDFGELDAFITTQFLSGDHHITSAQIQLLHNSFSDRSFIDTPKDTYKGIGRIRHERVDMNIGHLANIQVHSYQAWSRRSECELPYDHGHSDHFDVMVYRNNQLIGGKRFEKFEVGKLIFDQNKKDGSFLGHNELAREALWRDFLFNITSNSRLELHANTNLLLKMIYQCLALGNSGRAPFLRELWPWIDEALDQKAGGF